MSVPLRRTPSNRPRRKPLSTEKWLDDVLDGKADVMPDESRDDEQPPNVDLGPGL